jgi:putative nucleotidyltransferase with HDIG domain
MVMQKRHFISIVMIFSLFSLYAKEQRPWPPVIEKGILNLVGFDFAEENPLTLNGEWDFYWKQLKEPEDFLSGEIQNAGSYCNIPNFWTEREGVGEKYPSFGYATYHLEILIDKDVPLLGISIKNVYSAYTLYLNNTLIMTNGVVGKNAETTQTELIPRTTFFKPDSDVLHITLHVANFSNKYAGVSTVALGQADKIAQAVNLNVTQDAVLFGSIAVIGFYHLLLFLLRHKDKNLLFFGLFCLVIAVRTLLMGERLLRGVLFFVDSNTILVLEYLTVPLSAVLFSSFFYYHYRMRWYFWVHVALLILSVINICITICAPLTLSMMLATFYYFSIVLMGVFVLIGIVLALIQKRQGALVFLIGFIIIFSTVINDVLIFNRVIIGPYLLSFGLFSFIFSQATIISIYFATAFKEKDRLTKQLALEIKGTIQVILKLLATKDPYTASHQKRVTELATCIAKELGLKEEEIEAINLSGQIHDIGKISIPSEILCKPGRLSDLEFSLIKTHPETGYNILKEIEFPWPIARIVYQHHEYIDGTGYPQGLRGHDIDFLAKILTVADVVEAIASDRPYRAALGIEEGLKYIKQKRDIYFDSKVVDVCIRIFNKNLFNFHTKALGT